MNSQPSRSLTWDRLVADIAELAQTPPAEVESNARIVEDLGLDSVGLAELVVILIDEYGAGGVSEGLDDKVWEGVTVGQLFDEYLSAGDG